MMPRHPLQDVLAIRVTIVDRIIGCPYCRWEGKVRRHGIAGGALAASSRLRGMAAEHIRNAHPEEAKALGIVYVESAKG